jgi:hypothetical protein
MKKWVWMVLVLPLAFLSCSKTELKEHQITYSVSGTGILSVTYTDENGERKGPYEVSPEWTYTFRTTRIGYVVSMSVMSRNFTPVCGYIMVDAREVKVCSIAGENHASVNTFVP